MRALVVVLLGVACTSSAHNPWLNQDLVRDPTGLALFLSPIDFEATKRNSEYFFEVELQVNYGTQEIENKIATDLRRLYQFREDIGSGRLFGAPLAHSFPSDSGGIDYAQKEDFVNQLETKIKALQDLQVVNNQIKRERTLILRSPTARMGEEDSWSRKPLKINLSFLYQKFQIRNLIEKANAVSKLPSEDTWSNEQYYARRRTDVVERIKPVLPRMTWTARLFRKDGSSRPVLVQEGSGSTDLRPPIDEFEPTPIYADFSAQRTEEEPVPLRLLALVDKSEGIELATKLFVAKYLTQKQKQKQLSFIESCERAFQRGY